MVKKSLVLNIEFTRLKSEQAVNTILDRVANGIGGYACFSNVHTTVLANQNPHYKSVLNNSTFTFADGIPIYWYSKITEKNHISHIPGPDFMCTMLDRNHARPIRHYFLGSTEEVLSTLVSQSILKYPNAKIVGTYSPPFRELTEAEIESMLENIMASKPDLIWVGLGAPKQEQWMSLYADRLKPAFLLGVGAAFDFNAGLKKRAPKLVRRIGMEWLYRLLQEPKRLFSRYLKTNSLFLLYILKSILPGRKN